MRHLFIVFTLLLSGCAVMAPLSYNEHCATRGMKLAGVSDTNGSSTSFMPGVGAVVSGGRAESVSCEVPQSDADLCKVKYYSATAAPKLEYNDGIGTKRLVTGTGYFLFVLPGVIAKLAYDSQLDGAVDASNDIAKQNASMCSSQANR